MRHLLTLAVLQSALQCASHSPIHSHTIGGRAAIQASGLPSGVFQSHLVKLEMPGMDPKIRRQPDQTTNSIRKPHSVLTIALHKRTENSSVTMLFSTFLPSYLVFDTQL